MPMKLVFTLILGCSFVFIIGAFTQAADIDIKKTGNDNFFDLMLGGEIEKGDYEKIDALLRHAKRNKFGITRLHLACPGGDAVEAMRIGKLIRDSFIGTAGPVRMYGINFCTWLLPDKADLMSDTCRCANACFLVWAAGVSRNGNTLEVHRPYFKKEYFEGLSTREAQKKYEAMSNEVRVYLKDMDVPMNVIDKMFSASSTEIIYLDEKTVHSMQRIPFFDEWIKANCPERLSDDEITDLSRLVFKEKTELASSQLIRLEELRKKDKRFHDCLLQKTYDAQFGKKP
jgi:hypothetical protein